MSYRIQTARYLAHAKEFAEQGGTLDQYKIKHKDIWRELESENLVDRIFRPKRISKKRVSKIFLSGEKDKPTLPQKWFTPVLDLRN